MSQVGGGFGYFCLLSAGKWGIGLDPKGSGASQTWVEFVVGSPLLCGYFSDSSGFPPFTKTNIPNSNLSFETVDRKSHLMELSPLNTIIIMMAATIPLQIYGDSLYFAQRTWKEWWVFVHIILRWSQDCSRSVSPPVFVSLCKNLMIIYDNIAMLPVNQVLIKPYWTDATWCTHESCCWQQWGKCSVEFLLTTIWWSAWAVVNNQWHFRLSIKD